MILKKLILKNFMSYGSAEIDFSGIHVACLSGQNGAGKSSLLDAITWVLWEEGRARTDELIKLGQSEMSCELDFFMEENLYKVYRSRNKSFKNSQGKSNLEFQVFNTIDNSWKSLSLNTTRLTQDLIIKTLKMDYVTFVNSVYLRQGKADEFTTKKPSERKQILADILGLEIYDRLFESAKEKIKNIDQNISIEQRLIISLKEKCEKEEEIKTELIKNKEVLKSEEDILENIKAESLKKEKELNEKKEKERQIVTLENSINSQRSLLNTLENQLLNIKRKEENCNKLIENKDSIEREYAEYLSKKKDLEVLEIDKERFSELVLEKNKIEMSLKDKIQKIEQDLAVYKSKLSERTSLKNKLEEKLKNESSVQGFLQKSQGEIKEFKNLQEKLLNIETQAVEVKHGKEIILLEKKELQVKKSELNKNLNALSKHNHLEPCPLCKGEIADKERVLFLYQEDLNALSTKEKELDEKILLKEKEIECKRDEYLKIKEEINNYGRIITSSLLPSLIDLKNEKIEIPVQMKSSSKDTVSYFESQLEVLKSDFKNAKAQMSTVLEEINSFENEMSSLNKMIGGGEEIKSLSEKLKSLSVEILEIGFDEKKYVDLKAMVKNKESIISTMSSLNQATEDIKVLFLEKESLSEEIKAGYLDVEALSLLVVENRSQIQDIGKLSLDVAQIKNKERLKSQIIQEYKKTLILNEQILSDIENNKLVISQKEVSIQSSLDDKKHYEILEKAFSKNGIQAGIIETVVPEIENEANRILTNLTENQMHVALRTQKEKKAGGLTETLDVVIADNAGTRNYELYSGGEAFKIDFALRLALSRLLANRSGAKLKTLIIDEGFGSQDSAGKERLTEVIRSIQSEFELILVVTHIEELKEAFPTMIQVSKDDEGSKVSISS